MTPFCRLTSTLTDFAMYDSVVTIACTICRSASESAEKLDRLADEWRSSHRMASSNVLSRRCPPVRHWIQDDQTVASSRWASFGRRHQIYVENGVARCRVQLPASFQFVIGCPKRTNERRHVHSDRLYVRSVHFITPLTSCWCWIDFITGISV